MKPSAQKTPSRSTQKLTKTLIDDTPNPERGETVLWDSEVRGFGIRIGKHARGFFVARSVKVGNHFKTRQQKLGRMGIVTVDTARAAAREKIVAWSKGVDVDPKADAAERAEKAQREREQNITLAEAWQSYREIARAAKTQARYDQLMRVYLSGWMKRPLREISKEMVRERHRALAREIAAGKYAQRVPAKRKQRRGAEGRERPGAGRIIAPPNRSGESTANDVFRLFRAIYSDAKRAHDDLPPNPCIALYKRWFKTKPPRTAIEIEHLPAWWRGVAEIPNPVRRDLLRVLLLTGLRRESAAAMRWADIDFRRATLLIPKPKGGAAAAFTIPLSDYLVALLKERQADNARLVAAGMLPPDSDAWVFPAFSASGHVEEPREEIAGIAYTVHDLRRTFITQAEALDISVYAAKALVNHRQPREDVHAGYVSITTERLRAPMQKITDHLLRVCEGKGTVIPMRGKGLAK